MASKGYVSDRSLTRQAKKNAVKSVPGLADIGDNHGDGDGDGQRTPPRCL